MNEIPGELIGAFAVAIAWAAWTLFSETRHNHGMLIAFLLPLTPIIIPLLWVGYVLIKYGSYLIFMLRGRTAEHEAFMREFRLRSGVFVLF